MTHIYRQKYAVSRVIESKSNMPVLMDTGFLVALASHQDIFHRKARQAVRDITDIRIVPAPVLPELFYMLAAHVNYFTAVSMFKTLRTGAFQIEALTDGDMARTQQIMEEYADNEFDFVDMAIMAQSERLNISELYIFDRTDYAVFRPKHCEHFELLP
jgi:hypothetical protein